jgi:hypothetical protein
MSISAPKEFNISGPCDAQKHYMLPALSRLPEIKDLIKSKDYFVLQAPRQSGKTTLIKAVTREINADGQFYALYCPIEALKNIDDRKIGLANIVQEINEALKRSPIDKLKDIQADITKEDSTLYVRLALGQIAAALDKPLALFFDGVDFLSRAVDISFLAQLRDGFHSKNERFRFPSTVGLVSMRNINHYVIFVRPDGESDHYGSPYNIAERLTLTDFTKDEIKTLYGQHTSAVGQIFEPEAVERAWYWSEGQPWLVNALAKEAIEAILKSDFSNAITAEHIDVAAGNIMKRRDAHIDSLLQPLSDWRMRSVIETKLPESEDFPSLGSSQAHKIAWREYDLRYCADIGLLKNDGRRLVPSNPIYVSLMVRYLKQNTQVDISG